MGGLQGVRPPRTPGGRVRAQLMEKHEGLLLMKADPLSETITFLWVPLKGLSPAPPHTGAL